MDNDQLKRIIEGALLAAGRSLDIGQLQGLFDLDQMPPKEQLLAVLDDIRNDCAGRGYELKHTGSGYRFQVRQELAPWVNRLWEEKPKKYSRALLETLALIAYRQPLTRGDIEEIRGVSVSSEIIKTLLEREWVRVVGHRDVPGRPALYATTKEFLDYFSLKSLEELPALNDIRDIDSLDSELSLHMATQDRQEDDCAEQEQSTEEVAISALADEQSVPIENADDKEMTQH
ncbi:SMC-Scp complex subunit ScpB [Porticoccus sp.]